LAENLSPYQFARDKYEHNGHSERIAAPVVVLAASAVNSAVLLLRSACDKTPRGVANSSGLVGRNYMAHNNTALMSVGWAINKRSADHFTSALSIRQGQVLSGALSKLRRIFCGGQPGRPPNGIDFNFLLLKPKREVCVTRIPHGLRVVLERSDSRSKTVRLDTGARAFRG
jgi:hypothetical protein